MSLVHAKKIVEISQSADPKQGILDAVGDLSEQRVLYDLVLIGVYIRPEKTKSGIYLAIDTLREDQWQGTVGLILAMGPDAEKLQQETSGPEVGDWVKSSIKDGFSTSVRGTPCRLVAYDRLKMRVTDPSVIYGS